MAYVLASFDGDPIRHGGALGTDAVAWKSIEKSLPSVEGDASGATLALDFELAAGASTTRRVVLS